MSILYIVACKTSQPMIFKCLTLKASSYLLFISSQITIAFASIAHLCYQRCLFLSEGHIIAESVPIDKVTNHGSSWSDNRALMLYRL